MGAISSIIKDFDDSSPQTEQRKELLTTLEDLAETKAENFVLEIRELLLGEGTTENKTIPITDILSTKIETHAYASDSAKDIPEKVGEALKNFVKGGSENIIQGVTGLISEALTIFLGESSGSSQTLKDYYVMTEGLSIIRIDFWAWQLDIKAESLKGVTEKVCAFVAVKSSVDPIPLTYNTFLNLYSQHLSRLELGQDNNLAELDKAHRVFHRLKKFSND